MHDTILGLAQTLSGAAGTEASLLGLLCTAAEQEWAQRLRPGVETEDCREAFCCACAFSAVAGLLTGRDRQDAVSSFTAGDVSVRSASAAETSAAADALLQQAARLMAPYTREDTFCVRGVRG